MNKILCSLTLLVLLSPPFYLHAQSPETDSLDNLLKQHTRKETIRIRLLNSTARTLYQKDHERMFTLASDAIELSERLRYPKGKADGLQILGMYHYSKSGNEQAAEYFREALTIYEKLCFKTGISKSLYNLGRLS
ncbi:MAG: hypothetical protein ABFS28_07175 [Bacteroidota bacterium]